MTKDPEEIILEKLYISAFRKEDAVDLHEIRKELVMEDNPFWRLVRSMSERGYVEAQGVGGYYKIAPHGIIHAENTKIAPKDIVEANEMARTVIMKSLAEAYEADDGIEHGVVYDLSNKTNIPLDDLMSHIFLLDEFGYVRSVAAGCYEITRKGLDAVKDYRRRNNLAVKFDEISALSPQSRGIALQKLLAKVLEADGWSQEEGVKTSNEELDVVIHKKREYYLIECKWEKDPIEASVVRELYGKLKNRVGINAIIVSMSSFTKGAIDQGENFASDRIMLFIGPNDLKSLIYSKTTFDDMLESKYQQIITRKKIVCG